MSPARLQVTEMPRFPEPTQIELTHASPAPQVVLQPPQWLTSFCRSAQTVPQQARPFPQQPLGQHSEGGQHVPWPAQSIAPGRQTHWRFWQILPPLQLSVWIEWTHRLITSLVYTSVFVLVVWASLRYRAPVSGHSEEFYKTSASPRTCCPICSGGAISIAP